MWEAEGVVCGKGIQGLSPTFSMKEWALSTLTSLPFHIRQALSLTESHVEVGWNLGPRAGWVSDMARVNSAYHLPSCCPHVMLLGQPVLVLGVSCVL